MCDVVHVYQQCHVLCVVVQFVIDVKLHIYFFSSVLVFNATFNDISVISWRSVLLVEETGGPGENNPYMCIATYR